MESRARYILIGVFVFVTILGGFGFVYWLHAVGGLGDRAVYRIGFENSVSGLRTGAGVLFNGVRVGEVTGIALSPQNPHQVFVTVSVQRGTPIRADSEARIEVQGLMGSPSVAITGGSPALPPLVPSGGEAPVLTASPSAGFDLTQTARQALERVNSILAENAQPFHEIVTNIDAFSSALGRNSDRVDGILAGLEKMTGGASKPPLPTFSLASVTLPPPRAKKSKQLVVADPSTLVAYDTQRIILRNAEGATSFLENAQWADSLPKIFQAMIIESFENSRTFAGVGRPTDGLSADYQLLIEVRAFEVELGPPSKAKLSFEAKLVSQGGRILDARDFQAEAPVKAVDAVSVTEALNACFTRSMKELVLWASQKA